MFEHPSLEKALEFDRALKFVPNAANAHFASWLQEESVCHQVNAACHAHFFTHEAIDLFVTSFMTDPNDSVAQEVFRAFRTWVFGPKSPWRMITQQPDCFINERAVVFGPETLGAINLNFLKNFAVLLRLPAERIPQMKIWHEFVKRGLDPRDAFLLCIYLKEVDGKYIVWEFQDHNTSHWPLVQSLDYKKFWHGQVDQASSNYRINGFFYAAEGWNFIVTDRFTKGEVIKTTPLFGGERRYCMIDLDLVIEGFLKAKQKEFGDLND